MATEQDYYELLQVPYDADSKEIVATYRLLARQYHPDRAKDEEATQYMLALNRAIEVLGDPKRRREYDARRLQARAREALAREAAEAGSGATSGKIGDTAARRSSEPRLTRAVATWKKQAGSRRKTIAPPPTPTPTPKRRPIALLLGLGAAALAVITATIVLAAVSLGGGSGKETAFIPPTGSIDIAAPTPASTVAEASASPRATESLLPQRNGIVESRGILLVGAEMAPGIWRAIGAEHCSWKRLSARDPTDNAVIGSGSTITVEVKSSDVAFWSEGCGQWSQGLEPPSASPREPFGAGTWLVGEEIAPGLWQNSDSSQGCSWMRLSSLGGGPTAANATGSTSTTVLVIQITAADVAFHSAGCGIWTRIGN